MAASATKQIVIVGGGITGVSSAYYLATRRGIKTTLIDPVGIAPAASGKAGGFLAFDWNDGSPTGPLTRTSFGLHQELADTLGATNIDYRRLTCEAVATNGGGVSKPSQKKLDGIQWADLGSVGSRPMGGTDTIAQVHPKKLADALWVEAQRVAGSELLIDSVESLEMDEASKRVVGVRLRSGVTRACDAVLLAMGPWSPDWLGLPRAYGTKYHSVLMTPARTLSQCVFFQGLGDPEVYPRPDGTVYVTGFPDTPRAVTETPGAEEVRSEVVERLASTMR